MSSSSYLSGNEMSSSDIERDYRPSEIRTWVRLVVDLSITLIGVAAFIVSMEFVPLARYFAQFTAGGVAIVAGLNTLVDLVGTLRAIKADRLSSSKGDAEEDQLASDNAAALSAVIYLGTLLGCVLLVALLGIPFGGAVFVFAFLRWGAGWKWVRALLGGVGVLVATLVFGEVFGMRWPYSLLALESFLFQ